MTPDGTASVAADELMCPNGIAFDADEHLVFVAEPAAMRITRFARRADGTLGDRVEFARLPQAEGAPYAPPDGLCVDAEGGVWAADPIGGQVVHLDRDGTVLEVIDHPAARAGLHPRRRRRPHPLRVQRRPSTTSPPARACPPAGSTPTGSTSPAAAASPDPESWLTRPAGRRT